MKKLAVVVGAEACACRTRGTCSKSRRLREALSRVPRALQVIFYWAENSPIKRELCSDGLPLSRAIGARTRAKRVFYRRRDNGQNPTTIYCFFRHACARFIKRIKNNIAPRQSNEPYTCKCNLLMKILRLRWIKIGYEFVVAEAALENLRAYVFLRKNVDKLLE